jgi:hypothetical protein
MFVPAGAATDWIGPELPPGSGACRLHPHVPLHDDGAAVFTHGICWQPPNKAVPNSHKVNRPRQRVLSSMPPPLIRIHSEYGCVPRTRR